MRTLAQHIWAAASHKLQYKQEASVPPPLRRTIHRVSALLETVDLEFERVLGERRSYVEKQIDTLKPSERLNVDLVEAILAEYFPAENRIENEIYAQLLEELFELQVTTAAQFREVLKRNLAGAMEDEKKWVQLTKKNKASGLEKERALRGIYFTHVGLARGALKLEFGDEFHRVLAKGLQATKAKARRAKQKRNVKKRS